MKRFALTLTPLLLAASLTLPARADIPPVVLGQSPTLAPMLKNVLPAVVNVSITGRMEMQNPLMQDPFFRHFFGIPDQPQEREIQAVGSGVIVDAARGYVLTNHHVVEMAEKIQINLGDGRTFDAKLIGSDPDSDLAVLQVKGDNLKALGFADSDKLEVGDFVVAVGNPFGIGQTVTSGIVSALGRTGLGRTQGAYENFIQTDASINPGNSGGPLVTLKGELVGINSQIVSRTGTSAGIGFSIPSNQARFVLGQIIEHGSVVRGRIGIQGGQELTPQLAKAFGLPLARGALVQQVVPGSPAAKAGLKAEDIILKANGREVRDFNQFRNLLGLMRVGEKVDLEVWRNGKSRNVSVVLGKETEQADAGAKYHPALAGADFAPIDETTMPDDGDAHGVAVQRVSPRSPAARLGLRAGDIIMGVNRQRVESLKDFARLAAADQKELLLHVRRGNNAFFIVVE